MRVSINLMIKSLLVTMLIGSALTPLGPLNSTVPDAATVVRHGTGEGDGIAVRRRHTTHMENFEWVHRATRSTRNR